MFNNNHINLNMTIIFLIAGSDLVSGVNRIAGSCLSLIRIYKADVMSVDDSWETYFALKGRGLFF